VQHLAFEVQDHEALLAAKAHIEAQGIDVLGPTYHGIFRSIYFFDPNGHRLELPCNIGTPEQYAELARRAADARCGMEPQTISRSGRRAAPSAVQNLAGHGKPCGGAIGRILDVAGVAEMLDGDDFYSGIHHAVNVGSLFRPDNPLLPNYKYVPIGYHGRASSIRLSGVDVVRPNGQTKAPDADAPAFGPSKRLDYELEMAIWVGRGNALGCPVPIGEAADHIAGISILNDWSARDVQAWEYQPLGPFLAKNFHSTISPWIVTMDALAPYRTAQPARPEGDPAPLPYLLDAADQRHGALGLTMEVLIRTARMRAAGEAPHRLSQGPMTAMYWTIAQLLTHHASNGCNLAPGDLLGTGTLSGPTDSEKGSLLELSAGGKHPIALPNGETRTFLEDGDEIIIRAHADAPGFARIGFGDCRAMICPAP
jgi:fumarylacetoacetase